MKLITAKRGKDGQWYIRISHAGNNKTIGDGGQGYASRPNAVRAIRQNWSDGYKIETMRPTSNKVTFRMVPRAA